MGILILRLRFLSGLCTSKEEKGLSKKETASSFPVLYTTPTQDPRFPDRQGREQHTAAKTLRRFCMPRGRAGAPRQQGPRGLRGEAPFHDSPGADLLHACAGLEPGHLQASAWVVFPSSTSTGGIKFNYCIALMVTKPILKPVFSI